MFLDGGLAASERAGVIPQMSNQVCEGPVRLWPAVQGRWRRTSYGSSLGDGTRGLVCWLGAGGSLKAKLCGGRTKHPNDVVGSTTRADMELQVGGTSPMW